MSLADLSGVGVLRGRLTVPFSGLWHADLLLATDVVIAGGQTLTIAGAAWTCAYVRAVSFAGSRGVRVVGGTGGWRMPIPSKQYGMGTIPTLTVLTDAANACGEAVPVVDPSAPQTVGAAFLRQSGPASTVLQQVLGDAWWMDPTGTVQTAPRAGTIASRFDAMAVDGAEGLYEIATEAPNDWMPGASFSGPTVTGVISRVMVQIEPERLRVEVMVS
jgi:hypothetical protein